MKLFTDIVIKRIYLFNIVAWNYRKKIGFPVCKKENFAGLQAHRKRGNSARASPTPNHTLNEERSARFTAQPLSALMQTLGFVSGLHNCLESPNPSRVYIRLCKQGKRFLLFNNYTELHNILLIYYYTFFPKDSSL